MERDRQCEDASAASVLRGRVMRWARWSRTIALLLALTPAPIVAQQAATDRPGPLRSVPHWQVGLGVPGSFIVGTASDFLSDGIGILGFGGRRVAGPLWVRADLSYTWLRDESFRGEQADDALLMIGLGPEFDFGWRAFRVYLRGSGGLIANFQSRTASSLPEETSWAGFFGGGLGFRLRLVSGPRPVALDLGGDIFRTGELAFATLAEAGGSIDQDLGMITLRVGLVVGLP